MARGRRDRGTNEYGTTESQMNQAHKLALNILRTMLTNQQRCYGTLTLSRTRRLFQTRISILLHFQSPPVTRVTSLLTKHSQNTLVRLTLILSFLSLSFHIN